MKAVESALTMPPVMASTPWWDSSAQALDEGILWNAAPAEETNQHSVRRVNASDDNRIIGLWHFDEKAGRSTADSSGQGHDATLQNGPSKID